MAVGESGCRGGLAGSEQREVASEELSWSALTSRTRRRDSRGEMTHIREGSILGHHLV